MSMFPNLMMSLISKLQCQGPRLPTCTPEHPVIASSVEPPQGTSHPQIKQGIKQIDVRSHPT